ncbi:lysM domain-containing protein ARB_03442-like [Lycium ferocissimum]|uniref:lysM domain-containing protein ARB_03442-like n=1 Tax=Lycium ferocissimum TaxID=112874 RepID=UPI0028152EAC|nr:lysM domain-containing protein ARB_03442-like [Lycium ferocissimum]
MPRASYKSAIFFIFVLLFILSISMAESRTVSSGIGTNSALICSKIYGANIGDTCFSVMQQFSMTAEAFTTFNPNLNCDKMFVGEWICLDGSSI